MSKTKIEWCDHTINPIVGCSKCSPGCDNCYAEKMAFRLSKMPATAAKYEGVVDAEGKWTGKIGYGITNPHSACDPHLVPGQSKRVFVGSMGDLFHPNVSDEALDVVFASMLCDAIVSNSHGHEFVLLTKRADRMQTYLSEKPEVLLARWGKAGDGWIHIADGDELFSDYAEGHCIPQPGHEKHPGLLHEYLWPLPNVWLGVTVCNRDELHKLDALRSIPAARRFVSFEPLLGDLGPVDFTGIGWAICGAENGPKARPMHPAWPRSVRDQCHAAGVPFFHKGNGEFKAIPRPDATFMDGSSIPEGAEPVEYRRVGRKQTGRLLDGIEHNAFPPHAPGSFMAELPF